MAAAFCGTTSFNGWVTTYETYDTGHPKSLVATDDKDETVTDVHYV